MTVRRHKAGRRQREAARDPLPFEVAYDVDVDELDDDGRPTGGTVTEERVETFKMRGDLGSLQLAALNNEGADGLDESQGTAVRDTWRQMFGDDAEYARFYRFVVRYCDENDLIEMFYAAVEDFTARPTQPSSSSVPEDEPSGDESKVISLPGGYQVASAG